MILVTAVAAKVIATKRCKERDENLVKVDWLPLLLNSWFALSSGFCDRGENWFEAISPRCRCPRRRINCGLEASGGYTGPPIGGCTRMQPQVSFLIVGIRDAVGYVPLFSSIILRPTEKMSLSTGTTDDCARQVGADLENVLRE